MSSTSRSNSGDEHEMKEDPDSRASLSATSSSSLSASGATSSTSLKRMQALEIDDTHDDEHVGPHVEEEEDEDEIRDTESLLPSSRPGSWTDKTDPTTNPPPWWYHWTGGPPQRVGNMIVVLPQRHAQTGWGIIGPHLFGPVIVFILIIFASSFFIRESLEDVGIGTAIICGIFTISICYHLCNASFRDPGVVLLMRQERPKPTKSCKKNENTGQDDEGDSEDEGEDEDGPPAPNYRWCDICKAYQPPDGAHCPDCNVCIAGYDHHCVWMGTCIGKNNFREFLRFNTTWLCYLIYSIVWVTILGPIVKKALIGPSVEEDIGDG